MKLYLKHRTKSLNLRIYNAWLNEPSEQPPTVVTKAILTKFFVNIHGSEEKFCHCEDLNLFWNRTFQNFRNFVIPATASAKKTHSQFAATVVFVNVYSFLYSQTTWKFSRIVWNIRKCALRFFDLAWWPCFSNFSNFSKKQINLTTTVVSYEKRSFFGVLILLIFQNPD